MMSVRIASDVNFDYLTKVVSTRIFYFKGTFIVFVITKYFERDTLRFCKYPFSPKSSTHLSIH